MFCKGILSELQVGAMDELCLHFSTVHSQAEKRTCVLRWEVILNLSQVLSFLIFLKWCHFESFSSDVILNLISEVASSWQNSFFATARLMCFPPPWYCPFVLHNFCHNFPEIVQNSRQRIWNFAKPEFKCIRCILCSALDYHFVTCRFLIWILIVYWDLSETYG